MKQGARCARGKGPDGTLYCVFDISDVSWNGRVYLLIVRWLRAVVALLIPWLSFFPRRKVWVIMCSMADVFNGPPYVRSLDGDLYGTICKLRGE